MPSHFAVSLFFRRGLKEALRTGDYSGYPALCEHERGMRPLFFLGQVSQVNLPDLAPSFVPIRLLCEHPRIFALWAPLSSGVEMSCKRVGVGGTGIAAGIILVDAISVANLATHARADVSLYLQMLARGYVCVESTGPLRGLPKNQNIIRNTAHTASLPEPRTCPQAAR